MTPPRGSADATRVADRVIERATHRRRPLMPDDETVIRALVEHTIDRVTADGADPNEDKLVAFFVAVLGNLEFEIPSDGGFRIAMRPPDDSLYPGAGA